MLTIRHYKIFKEVAETANMSEAAKNLYVSQPTVSQTISELEKHYECKLFERFPKKLYITAAGKRLLAHVNSLIYVFNNVHELNLNEPQRFELHIGATHTVSSCVLEDILKSARKRDNNVDYFVVIDNTRTFENMILKNQLDFAIVEGTIKNKDIITVPIAEDCLVLICGANHPFAGRDYVRLSELNGQDFILRESGSGTRKLFETEMESSNVSYRVKWECSNFESVKRAAVAGEGLAVISARLIRQELQSGQLCVVPVNECMWHRDFYLCYHKNKTLEPQMRAFTDSAISYRQEGVACPIVADRGVERE